MTRRFRFAALAWLALLLPAAASAGIGSWTPIGPPGAFGVTRVLFDPRGSSVLYAETENAGLWRSLDGGQSWIPIGVDLPSRPLDLEVDPHNPGTLYATINTPRDFSESHPVLLKSADAGNTWEVLFDDTGTSPASSAQLVVDRSSPFPGTLYWLRNGFLLRTDDSGQTFQCFPVYYDECVGAAVQVTALAVDPDISSTVWAVSVSTLFRTTDRGETWTEPIEILPFSGNAVVDRLFAASNPAVLYAWSSDPQPAQPRPCFARSDDGGDTWKGYLLGEACGEPVIDPFHPLTVRIVVGREEPRLLTSRDGGETWEETAVPGFGPVFFSANAPDRLYLATSRGLFRMDGAGAPWVASDRGLQASEVLLLEASPEARGVLYAAVAPVQRANDAGWTLQKTTDGGRTWTALPLANPLALAFDPADPRHLFAAAVRFHRRREATSGVYESRDGGRTWKDVLRRKLPRVTSYGGQPWATSLAVDPRDPRTLYLGTIGSGLLKSTDGGRTFAPSNQGLKIVKSCGDRFCARNEARDLLVDPTAPGTLYLLFADEVYRSENGGATWQWASQRIFQLGGVKALAAHAGTLWAVAGASVFRSVDGSRRWLPAGDLPGAPVVTDLAATPAGIFVATLGRGVLRSVDGGRTWTEVSEGLPHPFVTRLEPDPFSGDRIFAGTLTTGVWEARFPEER